MRAPAPILAVVACASAALAPAAGATFKGRNGDLAYSVAVDEVEDCGDMGHHFACGPDYANIFRLKDARGPVTQLTSCVGSPGCHAFGVSWSRDGRRIAYELSGTIYVARRDGSRARAVARGYTDPAWSPGGHELAVANPAGIFRVRLRDGRTLQLSRGLDERPDWSSRGTIAFVRRAGEQGLYTVRADGRRLTRLTPPDKRPSGFANPSWSPDGRTIAYADNGGPLVQIPAAGGRPRRFGRFQAWGPVAWSPDGRLLAVPVLSDGIAIVRTNGRVARTVAKPDRGEVVRVAWQPRR